MEWLTNPCCAATSCSHASQVTVPRSLLEGQSATMRSQNANFTQATGKGICLSFCLQAASCNRYCAMTAGQRSHANERTQPTNHNSAQSALLRSQSGVCISLINGSSETTPATRLPDVRCWGLSVSSLHFRHADQKCFSPRKHGLDSSLCCIKLLKTDKK